MSIISREVARERFRRTLMAHRARTTYKFRDPEAIAAKYGSPSKLDRGQTVIPSETRQETRTRRKNVFAKG